MKKFIITGVVALSLFTPITELVTAQTQTVQASSKKSKAIKRAKNESKEIKSMDDFPLLTKYKLGFSGNKVKDIKVYCDESLLNSSESDKQHYFSFGVRVGMKALNSLSKSPNVFVYSGNTLVARSEIGNPMTFKLVK